MSKVIYIIAVALECIFVPLFLKFSWPDKCKKSLFTKILASSMFITTGICSICISGEFNAYARFILIGLIFGMLGDILLHLLTDNQLVFGAGLFAFLIGHIFYIIAYKKAMSDHISGTRVFTVLSVAVTVVIVVAFAVYAKVKKMELGIATIPVLLYAITISLMLVTAIRLGIGLALNGLRNDMTMISTVSLGSVLFMLSDATLALLIFGGKGDNRPLKIFNILTYYIAQILIGTSIIFELPIIV